MENYYFMRLALNWLSEPRHVQRLFAIALRVTAILVVPLSLVTFFKAGKVIFDLPASGILGGIIFQIFFVAAVYCVVHGLFIRARDMDALPGGDFYMFRLAATFLKAAGEAVAAFIALVAVGGGIFVWFTAKGVNTIIHSSPRLLPVFGDTSFMGGIEFMAGGLLSAVILLGLAYLLAQGLALVGELAARVREPEPGAVPERSPDTAVAPVTTTESSYRLRSGTSD
jgi:hypothetical protein